MSGQDDADNTSDNQTTSENSDEERTTSDDERTSGENSDEQTSGENSDEQTSGDDSRQDGGISDTPELSDEGKEKVAKMREAYDDERPTAVLPGTDGTITGTAVNEWIDDDGNPKFGQDEGDKPHDEDDKPHDEGDDDGADTAHDEGADTAHDEAEDESQDESATA